MIISLFLLKICPVNYFEKFEGLYFIQNISKCRLKKKQNTPPSIIAIMKDDTL